MNWIRRNILGNHQLLTTVACINLTGWLLATVLDLSDRTFYTFLIATVASGWLALRAADRALDRGITTTFDDDPDPFGMQVRADNLPTYDLTITTQDTNTTPDVYRGLTIGQLADHLDAHDVRTYLAEADAATVTAPNGTQLTWQPSTTDTTGETR